MAKINGKELLVYVDGVAIAATTSATLTIERDTAPTTTKDDDDWETSLKTNRRWSVQVEGLVDPSGTFNKSEILDLLLNDATGNPTIKFSPKSENGDGVVLEGEAIPTNYSESANNNEAQSLSLTFKGEGKLEKKAYTP